MILIVEDDPQIRQMLSLALKQAELPFETAGDGPEGLAKAQSGRFDLIVLDIGLPGMDGLHLCKSLRDTHETPVLFLTARDDEVDRLLAFEFGGDDYVTKPFSPRELIARIRAILKRTSAPATSQRKRGVLSLDPDRHHCAISDAPVVLTQREMSLLALLMQRPDHVVPRPQLTDALYGQGQEVSDRTLDSHLRNLRAKLTDAGCPDAIETVHGIGVRMGPCQGA
jgi:two-component system OmpR family response regulator